MGSYMNSLSSNAISNEQKGAIAAEHSEEEKKAKEDIGNGDFRALEKDFAKISEDCEREYPIEIWSKLADESKRNLQNAYIYSYFARFLNDNESTAIHKMGLTVECELKQKMFVDFLNHCRSEEANENNGTDIIILKCVRDIERGKDPFISLTEMLRTIKESYYDNTESNYAYELYDYLKEKGWEVNEFYSDGNENNFYLSYPNNYRNPSSHTYMEGKGETFKCKIETRKVLKWFLDAYNGPKEHS